MTLRNSLPLFLTAALAACGGGGGADTASTPATIATPATVSSLLPGQAMTWTTRTDQPLVIELEAADGRPAAGAGVRVFTLSRKSPQDNTPLEFPVPVSLLDSGVADPAGRIALTLQTPGHVDEVLVVATLDDTQGQRAVALDAGTATVSLKLKR